MQFKIINLGIITCGVVMMASCNKLKRQTTLSTEIDSVTYALGMDISSSLEREFPAMKNIDLFSQAILDVRDSSEVSKVLISKDKVQEIIRSYFMRKQREKQEKQANEQYGDLKIKGQKFLEENQKKQNVKVTESGLQYIVLKEGTGEKPTSNDSVTVHYHGTTMEGEVFDSSVDRKEPATFYLNQVIKGWTEGLQLMKEGAKYKFFIPQELAYGVNPPGGGQGKIKPFMPLIFEVELITINKEKK